MHRIVILGGGTGGTLAANRLQRLPQVEDIISVGELYEQAGGGEIVFT